MNVYVGATRQNEGKTVVCLGLLNAFLRRLNKVGYIKPVGQQFNIVDGQEIDKDAILMKSVYKLRENLKDMSPIAVPRGFTENYILQGNKEELAKRVVESYGRVSKDKKMVVIEGTGHAGVGSVFDMPNAEVARLLKTRVILVSCGGIGRPIDEIMLNKPTFDSHGIQILGVIINKVYPDKYDKINDFVRKGLERKNIEVLGVIPYNEVLSSPTLSELLEDIGGKLLSGEGELENTVNRIVVGAMPPHESLDYFGPGTLLITPGNREDIILAAMSGSLPGITKTFCVSGIVLTGGIIPHKNVRHLMEEVPIPVISVEDDTFATASKINSLIVKVRPGEVKKIKTVERLIEKYVDIDRILQLVKK
ncbi:MAG: AAA family ATPase [Candidatus Omnitrophota bacterium]|nr:MAG: AAA family ATPase [Candidatus Omnitrophota bacterium]